jgi:hypothetical protein
MGIVQWIRLLLYRTLAMRVISPVLTNHLNGHSSRCAGNLAKEARCHRHQIWSDYLLTKSRRAILHHSSSYEMINHEIDRIFVRKFQRQRLVVKENGTMLYVDGTRVHHELSRKFYWPNMINQIKTICKACKPCRTAKV